MFRDIRESGHYLAAQLDSEVFAENMRDWIRIRDAASRSERLRQKVQFYKFFWMCPRRDSLNGRSLSGLFARFGPSTQCGGPEPNPRYACSHLMVV